MSARQVRRAPGVASGGTPAARFRVAVTRDEPSDGDLSRALLEAGLEPVLCPAAVTLPPWDAAPLARASRALESYDWLIAASARAVAALMSARAGEPLPAALRAAGVGAATATALERAGARAILTALEPGAAALERRLREADVWPGRRVLLPRAEEGRPDIALALRELGAKVDEVVAYRTVARPAADIARDWQAARADAAIVASPSAAEALVRALGARALEDLAVVAIGRTTAGRLETLGVLCDVSPDAGFGPAAACVKEALLRLETRAARGHGAGGSR